MLLRKLNRLRI